MDKKDISIPIFDGEDCNMWKKRISTFLRLKKCEEVIIREKARTDENGWDDQDLKAIHFIYSSISNQQLAFVCTEFGIIKILDGLYLKESTSLQIVYRNKLEKIRLNNYSDTASFFYEFEKNNK